MRAVARDLWERGERDEAACKRCRFVGFQRYGKEVCAKTGGACAWDLRPAPPDLSPRAAELWRLWQHSQTQWNFGPVGPIGLNYAGLEVVARLVGIELADDGFLLIQGLEVERLLWIDEKRKEAEVKAPGK